HQMDMIFTHFGVSGPAVLRCSQFVVRDLMKGSQSVSMVLNALPDKNEDKLTKDVLKSMAENPNKSLKNILIGIVPERLLLYILNKKYVGEEQNVCNVSKDVVRTTITD